MSEVRSAEGMESGTVAVAPMSFANESRESGGAHRDDVPRTREAGERDDRLAHGTDAEHGHRLPEPDLGAVDRVKRRHEPASAAHESLGSDASRQPEHLHARLHPDGFGPPPEQAIADAEGDAVDASMRAPCRLAGDEALVARVTCAEHVEERDDVPLVKGLALHIREAATDRRHHADGHMAWDDRVRDAGKLAMMEMHVRTAHLGAKRVQQRGSVRQRRCRELAEDDPLMRAG
jgi:hypothetical protein